MLRIRIRIRIRIRVRLRFRLRLSEGLERELSQMRVCALFPRPFGQGGGRSCFKLRLNALGAILPRPFGQGGGLERLSSVNAPGAIHAPGAILPRQ